MGKSRSSTGRVSAAPSPRHSAVEVRLTDAVDGEHGGARDRGWQKNAQAAWLAMVLDEAEPCAPGTPSISASWSSTQSLAPSCAAHRARETGGSERGKLRSGETRTRSSLAIRVLVEDHRVEVGGARAAELQAGPRRRTRQRRIILEPRETLLLDRGHEPDRRRRAPPPRRGSSAETPRTAGHAPRWPASRNARAAGAAGRRRRAGGAANRTDRGRRRPARPAGARPAPRAARPPAARSGRGRPRGTAAAAAATSRSRV